MVSGTALRSHTTTFGQSVQTHFLSQRCVAEALTLICFTNITLLAGTNACSAQSDKSASFTWSASRTCLVCQSWPLLLSALQLKMIRTDGGLLARTTSMWAFWYARKKKKRTTWPNEARHNHPRCSRRISFSSRSLALLPSLNAHTPLALAATAELPDRTKIVHRCIFSFWNITTTSDWRQKNYSSSDYIYYLSLLLEQNPATHLEISCSLTIPSPRKRRLFDDIRQTIWSYEGRESPAGTASICA